MEEKSYEDYRVYDRDDIIHGAKMKIEHSIFVDNYDISNYISLLTHDEVNKLRTDSIEKENAVFEKLREAAGEWERQAAVTNILDKAIAYLKTPNVEHTSNKWQEDQYSNLNYISNKVYKMFYRFYEYSSYRTDNKSRYEVNWSVCINSPRDGYTHVITGQQKSYPTRAEAEKYMQGRIKAYSHLFKEISPPVPKEYAGCFTVSGKLLPGYTIEGEKEVKKKPSLSEQISSATTEKDNTSPVKIKIIAKVPKDTLPYKHGERFMACEVTDKLEYVKADAYFKTKEDAKAWTADHPEYKLNSTSRDDRSTGNER